MSDIDRQGNKDETRSNSIKNREKSRANSSNEDRRNHHLRFIYKKYSIEYKLKIIALSEKFSLHYIEREYGISRH